MYDSFVYYHQELGFKEGLRFKYVTEAKWTPEDAELYNEQLRKIFDYCVENKMYDSLKNQRQFGSRIKDPDPTWIPAIMCGVANRSISMGPNLKMYPCHRRYFTNPDDFYGEILEDGTYKFDQQKYDYYYYANHKQYVYVNGKNCLDCQKEKNKYCFICINSNRSRNGLESVGCGENCLMADIEFKWQMFTYNYFKENELL